LKILLYIIPFFVGALLPIQGGVNNLLSKGLNNPIPASFFSFLGGTLILGTILLVTRYSFPEFSTIKSFPLYYWIGGLLGTMFVTSIIYIAPITGIITFFSISIAGQFFMGIIIDHYGLFKIAQNEINLGKIVGILVVFLGTYIIQYFK
jgi:transporter family-2 protein